MRTLWLSLLVLPVLAACDRDGDDDDTQTPIETGDLPGDSGDSADPDDSGDPDDTSEDSDSADDADADGDGFATPEDCDDADPEVHPGATDAPYDGVDADCAGDSDHDADGDGQDAASGGGQDCDDDDPLISPAVTERCNAVDDDCDGETDELGAEGALPWFRDDDGDGHGAGPEVLACVAPDKHIGRTGDCDDADPTTFPDASPVTCDGAENDCDTATLEVGAGAKIGGTAYATIAAALAAAQDNQTLDVCEGRHLVSGLVVSRPLTLRGIAGAKLVQLDAQGSGPVLEVLADVPLDLRSLTLTGGLGRNRSGERQGGGIFAATGVDLLIEDSVITANTAGRGGGIYLEGENVLVLDSTLVTANEADSDLAIVSGGGGIYVGDDSEVLLEASGVTLNHADRCGGMELDGAITVEGVDSEVSDNGADLEGGGLCARDGAYIEGLTVADNEVDGSGGGISAQDLLLVDVVISGNRSGLSGGGVNLDGDGTFEDVILDGNVAGIDGGGVDVAFSTSTLEMEGGSVLGNQATFFAANGGGILLGDAVLEATSVTFGDGADENTPSDVGLDRDERQTDLDGLQTVICDDGSGQPCQ